MKALGIALFVAFVQPAPYASANENEFKQSLYGYRAYTREGLFLYRQGRYYESARYFFQAALRRVSAEQKAVAYARVANALTMQGMYESASYFYLKAIGSGFDEAIPIALQSTQKLVENLGGGMFKKYILKYTRLDQYPADQKDYYLYYLSLEHLLDNRAGGALNSAMKIGQDFAYYPQVLFVRGTAKLMLNRVQEGVEDFTRCTEMVNSMKYKYYHAGKSTQYEREDLYNRCLAGVARGHYQGRNYAEADRWYSKIKIESVVWPQVLYERAWNFVAQGEYNRALGKLVTYKAPVLEWFMDSEVELLRTLSYLQMCLYGDVNSEVNYFVKRYAQLGLEVKTMLEDTQNGTQEDFNKLYALGINSLRRGTFSKDRMTQFMNRFIRAPYFARISQTDVSTERELEYLKDQRNSNKLGLGGFLVEVLAWRRLMARKLGGAFIRERLDTEYRALLKNVQTIDIIKLEMLRRAKRKVENNFVNETSDEFGNPKRGSLGRPKVRDDQYFWDFNGEFWIDELGDYVFALRPECSS
jgi:tetratricopeptide (TPR) repeat protein